MCLFVCLLTHSIIYFFVYLFVYLFVHFPKKYDISGEERKEMEIKHLKNNNKNEK